MALGSMALGSELAERRCRAKALAHRIYWPSYSPSDLSLSFLNLTYAHYITNSTAPHTHFPSFSILLHSQRRLPPALPISYLLLTSRLVPSTGRPHQGRQSVWGASLANGQQYPSTYPTIHVLYPCIVQGGLTVSIVSTSGSRRGSGAMVPGAGVIS